MAILSDNTMNLRTSIIEEVREQQQPVLEAAAKAEQITGRLDTVEAETSVATASTHLLDTRTVDARTQGLTGDGAQVGTAAFTALMNAGAGREVVIPRGSYKIDGPIPVKANTLVTIQPGTVIEQITKYTPVFDIIDADDVVIAGNGAQLAYPGDRTFATPPSMRGDGRYAYSAGVWSNGNRTKVRDIRVSGFTSGVYFSAWNGSALADYAKVDNEARDIVVSDVDFGVLFGGQVNPVIRNVRGSYNLAPGSLNPSHLLYVTQSGKSRNIDVDGLRAMDGSGGAPFQFKGVDGGRAANLHAHNCTGLLSITDCNDLLIGASASADLGDGENGSVYIFGATARCQVDALIAAANTSTGYRMVSLDTGVRDTVVNIRGRQRQPTTSPNYTAVIRGTRNTITYGVDNLDNSGGVYPTGRPAVWVMSGAGHTVTMLHARGVGTVAKVDAGATGCLVTVDGGRIETDSAAQSIIINEPTTQLRREGLVSASVTGAGQTIRIDGTRFRTVAVTVTTADPFTLTTPYGTVPRGTRLTYIISNMSGGTMGTLSWVGHTTASTWTNPAAGQDKSIEFVWDGARWKEIGRTA